MTKKALIESNMSYMLEKYIRPDGGGSLTLDDLRGDEDLSKLYDQFFKKDSKKTKKVQKSDKPKKQGQPKVSIEDRASAGIDTSKCMCRIWPGEKYRLDNIQCSSKKSDGEYCKMHAKKIREHGPWWLGDISDPRPECAMGPSTAPKEKQKRHLWFDQIDSSKKKSKKTTPKKKSIPKKKTTPVADSTPVKDPTPVEDSTPVEDPTPVEPPSPTPSQASTHVPDSDNEDNEDQDKVSELSVDQNEYIEEGNNDEGMNSDSDDELPDTIESSDDEDESL